MIRGVNSCVHPSKKVVASRNLPSAKVRHMAERLKLLANPKRPVSVARRIADENIRHA
jgi:hypothetical protein